VGGLRRGKTQTGKGDACSAAETTGGATAALPSFIERVYGHREKLFLCAVQLLDDEQASEQVVAETLSKTLLRGLPEPGPGTDAAPAPSLERTMDRLLVSLAMVQLKALPAPTSSASQRGRERGADGPGQELGSGDARSERAGERIGQALAALPTEARVAVTLLLMQGRSLAETAELLGTSEATCQFFLNHGRKLLRRALQRDLIAGDDAEHTAGTPGQDSRSGGTTTLHDLRRNKKATARA